MSYWKWLPAVIADNPEDIVRAMVSESLGPR